MKTKILIIITTCIAFLFVGCNDYLDLDPTDKASSKLIWSNAEYAQLAVNNCYNYIDVYGQFGEDNDGQKGIGLTEGATETLKYGSLSRMVHMGLANELAFGVGVDDVKTVDENFLGKWKGLYERIMKVNETYADLKKFASFAEEDKLLLEAQLRFFRGFLYFELIKRYKEVIIYDEDLTQVSESKPLNTEEEGWNFVEADLRFAAEHLPQVWDSQYYGRITKGAANALLSRAMLFAERWAVAKEAAKAVIDSDVYKLNSDFKNAWKSGHSDGGANPEAILEFRYLSTKHNHSFDDRFSPKGDPNVVQGGMGVPTQEMVEAFEKADGTGFLDWSPWYVSGGTIQNPPYDKLEPRFHATILYNEATWKGRKIEPFIGGIDGWCSYKDDPNPQGRTTTGYYLRKLVDESHNFSNGLQSTQPWIAIRYAEVLLNYAEACYRSGDTDQANWAIKEIRARVKLPYSNKSGDNLKKAIRQERKVELAYEGHLYWDMRRWKLSEKEYTGIRVHGFKIEKVGEETIDDQIVRTFKYTYVDCDKQDRVFKNKLYRLPLPLDEINRNTAVSQYPEWR